VSLCCLTHTGPSFLMPGIASLNGFVQRGGGLWWSSTGMSLVGAAVGSGAEKTQIIRVSPRLKWTLARAESRDLLEAGEPARSAT
jgi:hypothetical protein